MEKGAGEVVVMVEGDDKDPNLGYGLTKIRMTSLFCINTNTTIEKH